MPIYVYEVILPDGSSGEVFEIQQSMQDEPLQRHPQSGQPVRRVYQAPNLTSRYSEGATRAKLDTKNIEKAGFTKYERDKLTGQYHRTAGKDKRAPDILQNTP